MVPLFHPFGGVSPLEDCSPDDDVLAGMPLPDGPRLDAATAARLEVLWKMHFQA